MTTSWKTALSSTQMNPNGANSERFHELEETWKVKLLIIDIRPLCMKRLF